MLCRVAAWLGRGTRSAPATFLFRRRRRPKPSERPSAWNAPATLSVRSSVRFSPWSCWPGASPAGTSCSSRFSPAFSRSCPSPSSLPNGRTGTRGRSDPADAPRGNGQALPRYLVAILVFGCGDFSRTLLILFVTQHAAGTLFSWSAASLAIALYVLHNAVSSVAALPIGALADRVGVRRVVIVGYLFAAATTAGFALLPATPGTLLALFVCSGLYIACEEVAEKAYAATLLSPVQRGMGMACSLRRTASATSCPARSWARFGLSSRLAPPSASSLRRRSSSAVPWLFARGRTP